MTNSAQKNAIEQRLDELTDIWNEFAQKPEVNTLRWLIVPDEARMIDLFLEVQNEETSDIPDLFIRFEKPFHDPLQYGFSLRDELNAKYEEIREAIGQEGLAADWTCPPPKSGDIRTFIECCGSFCEYYAGLMEFLVVVLAPGDVAEVAAWEQWLLNIVSAELPPQMKIMVIDTVDAPALERLAEEAPDRVESVPPELDMPGAMEELVRDAPGNGPGFTFRRMFVTLTNAAAAGDLKKSQRAADSALAIAVKEKWHQMQVVIHMALGGALVGAGKNDDALDTYRRAEQAAHEAEAEDDPAGPKLVLQSKMAQAGALIGLSRHGDAALLYENAAVMAESQEDPLMALENWRMAAYCHKETKDFDKSWICGSSALSAADQMEADMRANSTLPYVGQGLLRIAEGGNDTGRIEFVTRRMEELIGPDWQDAVINGGQPS